MYNGRAITAVIDGSFDGLMSVVFARYYDKLNPVDIVVSDLYQQRLDAEYVHIDSDSEKAERVYSALRKLSQDAAENVYYAFSNPDESRFMDIFNYTVLAFTKGRGVDRYLQLDYVRNVIGMRKYAGMEIHKLLGFVRFAQTRSGVLYSEIGPVNDVLYMVALHFTERLISEAWAIHDVKRKKAAIYDAKELILANTGGYADVDLCPGEEQFQELWVQFLKSVAVKERINPKLQRQLMPMRYRPYMTEFARGDRAGLFSDLPSGVNNPKTCEVVAANSEPYPSLGAPTGHTPAQAPQEIHSASLTT